MFLILLIPWTLFYNTTGDFMCLSILVCEQITLRNTQQIEKSNSKEKKT